MKRIVILILICVLSESVTGVADVTFEESVNASFGQFIAMSEYFEYYALPNSGLVEIDKETGGSLVYTYPVQSPEYVYILDDNKLLVCDGFYDSYVTDLYEVSNQLYMTNDDTWILYMCMRDDWIYYYTGSKKLYRIQLPDGNAELLLADYLIYNFIVTDKGIWYSDDMGLYFLEEGSDEPILKINDTVGFLQEVENKLFFSNALNGTISSYDPLTERIEVLWDGLVDQFILNEELLWAVALLRPDYELIVINLQTEDVMEVTIPEPYKYSSINLLSGVPYVLCTSYSADGIQTYAIFSLNVSNAALTLQYSTEGDQ